MGWPLITTFNDLPDKKDLMTAYKLSSYGIGGNLYAVIKSFLSGRSLKVVINGQSSEAHAINAGVPQGSILSPTLILLFINDLPNHIIESLVDIYADDSTLYKSTSSDDPTVASDISLQTLSKCFHGETG